MAKSFEEQFLGPVKVDPNAIVKDLEEIQKANVEISEEIQKAAEEQAATLKEVLEVLEAIRKADQKSSGGRKRSARKEKDVNQALFQAYLKMSKQNKTFSDTTQKALKSSSDAIESMVSSVASKLRTTSGGKGGPGNQGSNSKRKKQGPVDYEFDDTQFANATNMFMADVFASLATGLAGGVSIMEEIISGLSDDMKFYKQMKLVAYQTRGITENTNEMQNNFIQIGKTVAETGYGVTTFQQALLQNIKKGVKNAAEVSKSGMNLGKMLGMSEENAVQMAGTFGKWKNQLGLSVLQIDDISRGIQEVSKYTGIIGDNMQEVVQSSEQYLKRMEAAGNLTSTGAKNTIMLEAAASKLGISDEMSELQRGLSNSADLLLKTGAESQSMLLVAAGNAGRLEDVMNGTLKNTKQGLKDLAGGYNDLFKSVSGGVDLKDIDKLDAQTKSQINLVLESAFGKGIEDFKKIADATAEAGKTYGDRINDINKKLNDNLTVEEKIALSRQKQEMQMFKAFEFSSSLADMAKDQSIKTIDAAVEEMKRKAGTGWPDMVQDLTQLTDELAPDLTKKVKAGDNNAIAKAVALSSAKALKEGGGKDYSQKLLSSIKKNDLVEFRKLQGEMNEEQKKLGIDTITALDPMEQMAKEVHMLNEQFRSIMSPMLNAILSMVGGQGMMIGQLSLMASSMFFSGRAGGRLNDMMGMLDGVGKFGKGGNTAANIAGAATPFSGMSGAMGAQAAKTAASTGAKTAATSGFASMTGTMGAQAAKTAAAPAATAALAGAGGTATGGVMATATAWAGPIALALGAILGTVGAIVGNLKAGAKAAEIFSVEQEKLTLSQYYAAKGAGTLTGALNFMTFGIFNKWLGITGPVTKALAKLNEKIPILSAVAAVIDVAMGVIWGFVKAIWNIIAGVVEGVYLALEPIGELFGAVFEVITALLSPFAAFDAKLSETGSLFTIVSDIIGGVGMAVRWLLRILGKLIGFIIKGVIKPISLLIKTIAYGIKTLLKPLGDMLDGLMDYGIGILKIFQGIFTFNFKTLWEGVKRMFTGAMQFISSTLFGFILSIPQAIFDMASSILLSVGTLFDGIEGPIGSLLQLIVFPFKILGELLKSIGDTIGGIYDMVVGISSFDGDRISKGFWNAISSIPAAIGGLLMDLLGKLKDILIDLPVWLFNRLKDVLIDFPRWLARSLIDGLQYLIVQLPAQLWNSLMFGLDDLANNEWIGPIFEPFLELLTPLSDAMNELFFAFNDIFDAIGEAFAPLNDLIIDLGLFSGEGSIFKSIVHSMAEVIGFLIKTALAPLKWLIQAIIIPIEYFAEKIKSIAIVIKEVATFINDSINAIMNPFKTLFDWIESKLSWITGWFKKKDKKEDKKVVTTTSVRTSAGSNLESKLNATKSAQAPEAVLAKKLREQELLKEAANNTIPSADLELKQKFGLNSEQLQDITKNINGASNVQIGSQPNIPSALRTATGLNDVSPIAEPNVKPASLQDVHTKMQREQAATNHGGERTNIPEFAKMISINEEQLHYMMLMHDEMKKVASLLTPRSTSGMTEEQKRVSTASNIKPTNSPNYNTWQFGRYQQNPSKQIITTGV